ncbi:Aliphatic amidase [Lacipirellula limnantheis]|uniref:Aliphatic amidase n=2 Tax=Lacipirellula limnantheis TaxID=2528024 RepID=A0A517TXM1_9BACT|nr:Aliphatic amidase [Lacipirellula limnantheis]
MSSRETIMTFLVLCGALSLAPAGAHAEPIGRPVKVSAIAIGFGGEWEAKMKLASEHLEVAGSRQVDIACLPEEFAGLEAEPLTGRTTKAIGALAKKHRMWVVCPIREQAPDGKQFNTAVLLDREGEIAGYYRKVFVFWDEDLHASDEGVKTFDTDFGRIALLTCFDANFDEVWQSAERQGAEIVLWPSAYAGGIPLNGYAMIHNYAIVAVGRGNIIDVMGRDLEEVESPLPQQFIATIDLDTTIVHSDFNGEKVSALLKKHQGEIEEIAELGKFEGWHVLKATAPGVSARAACREFELETLREYRQRSRREINERRVEGKRINLKPQTPDGSPVASEQQTPN